MKEQTKRLAVATWLQTQEWYDDYVTELFKMKTSNPSRLIDILKGSELSESINYAFHWSGSTLGYDYWSHKDLELKRWYDTKYELFEPLSRTFDERKFHRTIGSFSVIRESDSVCEIFGSGLCEEAVISYVKYYSSLPSYLREKLVQKIDLNSYTLMPSSNSLRLDTNKDNPNIVKDTLECLYKYIYCYPYQGIGKRKKELEERQSWYPLALLYCWMEGETPPTMEREGSILETFSWSNTKEGHSFWSAKAAELSTLVQMTY